VEEPSVQAEAVFVADLQTAETYFDVRSQKRWPIASITKLMTAVIVSETANATDTVVLGDADFSLEDTSTEKRLKPGETYTVLDLMSAMLVISSNEAAEALARRTGRAAFLAQMNSRAAAWGMQNTHFADPTGLSSANQSTARDLQQLALRIYQEHPEIFQTSRKYKVVITDLLAKKKQTLQNINLFAGETWFVGGKTGYTEEAGGNLLTVFTHSRRPVIVVALGTADRFGESERLIDWFSQNYKITSAK
jgi:D-alanyl-D-alanine endopeptidase (penicillin-binding protein 7)